MKFRFDFEWNSVGFRYKWQVTVNNLLKLTFQRPPNRIRTRHRDIVLSKLTKWLIRHQLFIFPNTKPFPEPTDASMENPSIQLNLTDENIRGKTIPLPIIRRYKFQNIY